MGDGAEAEADAEMGKRDQARRDASSWGGRGWKKERDGGWVGSVGKQAA